jgi:hypothetical protein
MKSIRSFVVIIIVTTLFSAACGRSSVERNSSAPVGALTANSALNPPVPKRFALNHLNGSSYLNEYMRPEVRARLDEEPVGDADAGFDPGATDAGASGGESSSEPSGEVENTDEATQAQRAAGEDAYPNGARLDTLKYSWAKKSFGDAVKAAPTNNGVIVLFADENYFDIDRLMGFVEEGRNRIAEASTIGGERMQVVFGGYRAAPQIELWVIPQGSPMPEFKTEARPKPDHGEN